MGMYTELVLGVELSKETPKEVIDVLRYMTGEDDENLLHKEILENHPFFSCDRWKMLLICDSYYFDGQTHSEIVYDKISNSHFLTSRSNLKNYDDEIDLFLNWIDPYVTTYGNWGYKRYEEASMPTIIFRDDNGYLKLLYAGETIDKAYGIDVKEIVENNITCCICWRDEDENKKWQQWLNRLS